MVEPIVYAGGSATEGLCAMEHLSRERHDAGLTDFPVSVDHRLARLVQIVNDSMCDHNRDMRLCDSCAAQVMALARRTLDTRPTGWSIDQSRRLYVHLALAQARRVEHLSDLAQATNDLVQAWLDGEHDETQWERARDAAAADCRFSYFPDVVDERADAALTAAHAIVNIVEADMTEHFVSSLIAAAQAGEAELIDVAHHVIDMFVLLSGVEVHAPAGREPSAVDELV